jgi:hypothetical protein
MTQSIEVVVEADDKDEAEQKALDLGQDGLNWEDDDSFHAGESGTYVADPDTIEEIA